MNKEDADNFVLVEAPPPRTIAPRPQETGDPLWHERARLVGAQLAEQFQTLLWATVEELTDIKDAMITVALRPQPVCWYADF